MRVERKPKADVRTQSAPSVPVRRFEMGASGEGWDRFLADRGFRVGGGGMAFKVWTGNGRRLKSPSGSPNFSRKDLMALLDRERVKAGLQPIKKAPY